MFLAIAYVRPLLFEPLTSEAAVHLKDTVGTHLAFVATQLTNQLVDLSSRGPGVDFAFTFRFATGL